MVLTLDKVLKHIDSLYLENRSNTKDVVEIKDIVTEKIQEPPSYFSDLDVSLDLVNRNFLESVILCIDAKYLEFDNKERKNYIQIVRDREREQYETIYKDKKYRKFGFTKKNLLDSIKEGLDSELHILYVSDFFNLNIFIIDTEQINVYYSEDLFNKFKSSLVLFKKEDNLYTHIKTKSKTVFTYHDNVVKHLLKKENWDNLNPVYFKKDRVFDIGIESLDTYLKNYCIIDPEELEEAKKEINEEEANKEEEESKSNKIEKVKKIKKQIKKELKENSEDRLEVVIPKEELDLDEVELEDDLEMEDEENAFDEETLEEDEEEENEDEDEENLENTSGVFMKRITKSNNLEIKVSTRMKKDQLLTLAKELKIETKNGKKEKTKKELCDEINSKI